MPPNTVSTAILDKMLHENYPEVVELGFVRQNLASIVDSTCNLSAFQKAAQAIRTNSELIKSLKSDMGFTMKNLSSVLSKSRENCGLVIQKLFSNSGILLESMGKDKFSPSNIAWLWLQGGASHQSVVC
jgi:hypothetical protein